MIKNKISVIALLVLTMFGLSGCTDWLDVKPESQIILDDYWKSESDVDAVLASCYRGLTTGDVISRMIVWGELRSDNMTVGSGYFSDMKQILDGDLTASNTYCQWGAFYSVINYCNTLLHYAPLVIDRDENFTENDLNTVKAEALAIRALCYFYLVRTFRDVPWMENASVDDAQDYNLPNSSERVVLDHIIADLQYAQKYARKDFGNPQYNKGRITLKAVNALLADVYLWDKQYDKCIETCNNILADPNLELVKSPLMLSSVFYNGNSTESIFELQFDDDVATNSAVFILYGNSGFENGFLAFPTTLAYDPTKEAEKSTGAFSPFNYKISANVIEGVDDIRAKDFCRPSEGGDYFIFKYAGMSRREDLVGDTYKSVYRYRSNTANWIIYRLSDVMLMKAEALVQKDGADNFKSAMDMINISYLRSNSESDSLYVNNYGTKAEMEKLVLRERQRELMFEGKRWFDLVRLARRDSSTSTVNDYVEHKASENAVSLSVPVLDALYMPLPKSEVEANPNLIQNPYYKVTTSSSKR